MIFTWPSNTLYDPLYGLLLQKKTSISLWSFVRDVAKKFIQENFNPNDRPFVVSATDALQTTSMYKTSALSIFTVPICGESTCQLVPTHRGHLCEAFVLSLLYARKLVFKTMKFDAQLLICLKYNVNCAWIFHQKYSFSNVNGLFSQQEKWCHTLFCKLAKQCHVQASVTGRGHAMEYCGGHIATIISVKFSLHNWVRGVIIFAIIQTFCGPSFYQKGPTAGIFALRQFFTVFHAPQPFNLSELNFLGDWQIYIVRSW